MKTLRLILGDQLNHKHSWFRENHQNIYYFIAEMQQETDYVAHHIQKVVAFFESMQNFAEWIESKGHQVIYYQIDNKKNQQNLEANIQTLVNQLNIQKFEYQLPDEYRLDTQLKTIVKKLSIESEVYDTEHYLTKRNYLESFFLEKKSYLMESFYRHMRKEHNILIDKKGEPIGNQWNFDKGNRKKWNEDKEPPQQYLFRKNVEKTLKRIQKEKIKTIGTINPKHFTWPTSRADSLKLLNHFCKQLLPHFGDYQDAMDPNEAYLFHSRLSFSLNCKLLSPSEVINHAIDHWESNKKSIHINQIEGFIRQILGWREYMRGIYWQEMPSYSKLNKLRNYNPLPNFYWTGETDMYCLKSAINNSLEHAYAHHIQRLMITGNFALLTQTDPDQVDTWYLGIYIDAIQWVELPNTRGMSQYADGGLVATKPYISSGSYINKMSNYCQNCRYDVKKRTGSDACPFNSLYWNFLLQKRDHFKKNPRMSMMLSLVEKLTNKEKKDIQVQAESFIKSIHRN
ncbi:cryptochrome/photolyase family protein [Microbulbifer sp. CnH-101-G]|uniref:cryptochrome/photolyase family protein n=1 Tax=Microbulbifer sp. CnH-101-G TaxID=3243393 RepID=UPI00403A37CD